MASSLFADAIHFSHTEASSVGEAHEALFAGRCPTKVPVSQMGRTAPSWILPIAGAVAMLLIPLKAVIKQVAQSPAGQDARPLDTKKPLRERKGFSGTK
jgi:hypothetical protein